jgi:hypothetical protein
MQQRRARRRATGPLAAAPTLRSLREWGGLVELLEHNVLVVSIDRLTHVLRVAARLRPEPPPFG